MKVKFIKKATQEQIDWRRNDNPNKLTVGKIYEVEKWDEDSWHTDVTLKDIKGTFNSVSFQII
jgi:hypothetical protein|tara:strand:+ start:2034 stop:2222 length:189 start_codon:yes stop_codon:yes gene_type:complete